MRKYFELAEHILTSIIEIKRVEVERQWAFDENDMPAVNIKEIETTNIAADENIVTGDTIFSVFFAHATERDTHRQKVESFLSIRRKLIMEIIRFDGDIECMDIKSAADGAEYTFLWSVIRFKINDCI